MSHEYYLEQWKAENYEQYLGFFYFQMDSSNFLKYIENIKPGEKVINKTTETYLITVPENDDDSEGKKYIVTFDFNFEFTYEEGFTKLEFSNLKCNIDVDPRFLVSVHYILSYEYWLEIGNFICVEKNLFPHL